MNTFELAGDKKGAGSLALTEQVGLGSAVLLKNALWFITVRWLIASGFIAVGLAGLLVPATIERMGFMPPQRWPWVLAGILIAANVCFRILLPRAADRPSYGTIEKNIWAQIVVDLVVVTLLVHIVGSVETFVAFTYLFHIALACIFFPRHKSLLVTCLAAVLYLGTVVLELVGVLPRSSVLAGAPGHAGGAALLPIIFAVSGVVIWSIVWYLVSTLSKIVQDRDQQLDKANRELLRADQEKNQDVLRTAHDLKAPFTGIETNIQIMKLQYWDEVPPPVQDIINAIQVRAQALSERIKDILVFGTLKGHKAQTAPRMPVDLRAVFDEVVEEVGAKAEERGVTLHVDVPSIIVRSDAKQLSILFCNLAANAILYSKEGGNVEISTRQDADAVCVSITDHGIGIRAEALPHIFEEYYRTKEAARFNKLSTGLGLTIVKRVALNLGLKISVSSEIDKGTTFKVEIPCNGQQRDRRPSDGKDHDHR